ncbi:MAG: hypothetical protein RR720_19780, partial [Comamonas sp.]|uniref:hypothetical protein n=1 Tax=Comamonas sp. TaxID=34028 RepID=UPI002FCB2A24
PSTTPMMAALTSNTISTEMSCLAVESQRLWTRAAKCPRCRRVTKDFPYRILIPIGACFLSFRAMHLHSVAGRWRQRRPARTVMPSLSPNGALP